MQTTFDDWNSEGTWEAMFGGDSINIHRSTGEHDFHGLPKFICQYSPAVDMGISEPRFAQSDSKDGMKVILRRRFRVADPGNLIGEVI